MPLRDNSAIIQPSSAVTQWSLRCHSEVTQSVKLYFYSFNLTDYSEVNQKSIIGHLTVIPRLFRGHKAVTLWSLSGYSVVTQPALRGHSEVTQRSLSGHSGVTQRSLRGHSGVTQ